MSDQKLRQLIPCNLSLPEEPIHSQKNKENVQFPFLLPVVLREGLWSQTGPPNSTPPWSFCKGACSQPTSLTVEVYKVHTPLGGILEKEQLRCE